MQPHYNCTDVQRIGSFFPQDKEKTKGGFFGFFFFKKYQISFWRTILHLHRIPNHWASQVTHGSEAISLTVAEGVLVRVQLVSWRLFFSAYHWWDHIWSLKTRRQTGNLTAVYRLGKADANRVFLVHSLRTRDDRCKFDHGKFQLDIWK